MIVYSVKTYGGQILGGEPRRVECPGFLVEFMKKEFKRRGFCYWELGTPDECIIYPTEEAAWHAINWAIEN